MSQNPPNADPLLLAVVGLIGAGVTQVANLIAGWRKARSEEHVAHDKTEYEALATWRKELMEQLASRDEKIERLESDLDHWKQEFFKQVEKNSQLQNQVNNMEQQLTAVNVIQEKYCRHGICPFTNPQTTGWSFVPPEEVKVVGKGE